MEASQNKLALYALDIREPDKGNLYSKKNLVGMSKSPFFDPYSI